MQSISRQTNCSPKMLRIYRWLPPAYRCEQHVTREVRGSFQLAQQVKHSDLRDCAMGWLKQTTLKTRKLSTNARSVRAQHDLSRQLVLFREATSKPLSRTFSGCASGFGRAFAIKGNIIYIKTDKFILECFREHCVELEGRPKHAFSSWTSGSRRWWSVLAVLSFHLLSCCFVTSSIVTRHSVSRKYQIVQSF